MEASNFDRSLVVTSATEMATKRIARNAMTDFVTRVIPTKINKFVKLACNPMSVKKPATILPKNEFAPLSFELNCAATGTRAPMLTISEKLASNMHVATDKGLAPGALQNIAKIFFIPSHIENHETDIELQNYKQ